MMYSIGLTFSLIACFETIIMQTSSLAHNPGMTHTLALQVKGQCPDLSMQGGASGMMGHHVVSRIQRAVGDPSMIGRITVVRTAGLHIAADRASAGGRWRSTVSTCSAGRAGDERLGVGGRLQKVVQPQEHTRDVFSPTQPPPSHCWCGAGAGLLKSLLKH